MNARTGLRVQRLQIQLQARDDVDLGRNPGSTLRGALAAGLFARWCHGGPSSAPCHWRHCPACFLLLAADPHRHRGQAVPRPYALEPGPARVEAGALWSFSLTLIGPAIELGEAVVDAIAWAAGRGFGRGRGRSTLLASRRIPPISGAAVGVLDDDAVSASCAPAARLTVTFRTPLRLVHRGALVKRPDLVVLTHRLLERLEALSACYSVAPPLASVWRERRAEIAAVARAAQLVEERTRWVEAWSGSRRTGTRTPTGGIVGAAVWQGELTPLVPWLRWGEAVHVGKNAVKGDGWMVVQTA
ncbi:MAG: CRISPR system precrRNA processing endoribonuclease RAMP protein Cas6 [Chloroflexota bacterium]|nr:CRISPR system precrRNA processing endoribonuclease RAMP protein Cas6 [Dehalococcoidia bacterium]MDW8254190.1 CRISPR system precrRNA processing endoribonuclease RAMP protein Cas6 [Chloroflexota bacterium]